MEESRARYRFGALSSVNAEAIGVPGQRTFRLVLESGAASASVWLEKEQLSQFAIYLQETIESLPDGSKVQEGQAPELQWNEGIATLDFKVGKLALGHDSASNCFLIVAHDVEDPEESAAALSFWLTLKQGEELAEEALKVCAAGRPRCFLCGQPINPEGHMCIRANGHAPLQD
jgi:uncharacterized repeat protein (TIGR03847 family)